LIVIVFVEGTGVPLLDAGTNFHDRAAFNS